MQIKRLSLLSPLLTCLLGCITLCCAGAHPTDVRMTTRFKQDDLTEGITGEPLSSLACVYVHVFCCMATRSKQDAPTKASLVGRLCL